MDNGFPEIVYEKGKSPRHWGHQHGEEFRAAIKELLEIRRDLMLEKNPKLKDQLDVLAKMQWEKTRLFAPELVEEMQGICEGSALSITDIVIVNNYTDFRDIEGHDQGCSTVYGKNEQASFIGQTWDMHSSAKKYVSTIRIPESEHGPETVSFSLVGCTGMAGVNSTGHFIGVNNINTLGAEPGVIWPVLVRKVLQQTSFSAVENILTTVAPTSGHSYLIGGPEKGSIWEISPGLAERTGHVEESGHTFHTNHCLGAKTIEKEVKTGVNSTTLDRYALLDKKVSKTKSAADLEKLLKDHEGYPRSICSHFESGTQDPSMTCGGIVHDYSSGDTVLWRGCEEHDDNYKELRLNINKG